MLKPRLIATPATMPISLAEAKVHMRVDDDFEDDLITSFISAAIDHVDGYSGILGRCLINQTWALSGANFNEICLLPFPDVSSAIITYFDGDEVEQTFDSANYSLLETPCGSRLGFRQGAVIPTVFARADAVTVEFVAGYGVSGDKVPAAIRQALKMMVAYYYDHRDVSTSGTSDITPLGVSALIAPYRQIGL